MNTRNGRGAMPALMIEMHPVGSLDLQSTERDIEAMLDVEAMPDADIHGLIILGTLGKNPSLTPGEKSRVMACAVNVAAGKVPVIAGVAEYTATFAQDTIGREEKVY
ncbi:MAG: dihydrodipicolinate synthase/N-acetylneuraminate lyase [Congregibacter sp.]|jgi:4-hydroxy-tetrahydrodipicolinate synthase